MPEDILSEREIEILQLIATGASNKEIALQLAISINTVKVHVRNVFSKIKVSSRTEAAMYAINNGFVDGFIAVEADKTGNADIQTGPSDNSLIDSATINTPRRFWDNRARSVFLFLLLVVGLVGVVVVSILRLNQPVQPQSAVAQERWQLLSSLPNPRYGFGSAMLDADLYVIGGLDADHAYSSVDRLDVNTQVWKRGRDKPTPVGEVGAVVLRGLMLAPGGRLSSGAVTDQLEIYDPRSDSWSSGKAMPTPLSAYAIASYEGYLYLFGGWDGQGFTNKAFVYDLDADEWTALPPMPTACGYAAAVVSNRKIYLIGGYDGKSALRRVAIFNPDAINSNESWQLGPELPASLYDMAGTGIADLIYVLGGKTDAGWNNTIYIFNPIDSEWQINTEFPYKFGSSGGVVSAGPNLYILGGRHDNSVSGDIWLYKALYSISFPVIQK